MYLGDFLLIHVKGIICYVRGEWPAFFKIFVVLEERAERVSLC